MTQNTIVLITGSKAGIGKGLLKTYVGRPNTIAIAAIRDGPNSEPATELEALPAGPGSKVIVAQYDASSTTAAEELASYLRNEHQIDHLDVVVANAGILKHFGPARTVKAEELSEHFAINTLAPILLYQSTAPLLDRSEREPKFFIISSVVGSNSLIGKYPTPTIAYGLSKAGANYAAGRMHVEEERIVVMPVQPGWVQTSIGEHAATLRGVEVKDVPVTLDASVGGLIKVFDSATKAGSSGRFFDQNNKEIPW